MSLSEQKVLAMKIDYELGKVSKTSICKKHGVSRPTLRKQAAKGKWLYQKSFQRVSDEVEKRTIERLIEDQVDKATILTDQFLEDTSKYMQLAMMPASELARAYNHVKEHGGKVTKEEFSRIWESTKAIKNALEMLNVGYAGTRKALGMDKDEEIRKAKEIKQSEQIKEVTDPLEGKTIEEVKTEIEKLNG